MTGNIFLQTIKTLFLDFLGEILYFPFWWYGSGLKKIVLYIWQSTRRLAGNLSLRIMLKNLFRPMYGQYDRAGRAISFFMRIILLFSRLVVFIVLSIMYLCILLVWMILPILILWQLLRNLHIL
ncbi:hypothetical protein H6761_00150 [Candidatus Nomurabacteria bacterium]|nr:hypothetical protein [Candidatus Nomurabacteria bacterium]